MEVYTILCAFMLCIAVTCSAAAGPLTTCVRTYNKKGCYKGNVAAGLILSDRHYIRWNQISDYLHDLACRCSKKLKEINADEVKAGRAEKYAGFSLHYYGDCYGQSKANLSALESRSAGEKYHCFGDQTYFNCKQSHGECMGNQAAEYVYEMKNSSPGTANVDGGYSPWQNWTACNSECGPGQQFRERTCSNPEPKGNGKDCSSLGGTTESRACKLKECPVNGGYSAWTSYGECSKSCGGGVMERRRTCNNPAPAHGGSDCSEAAIESKSCNNQLCPINGNWSPWSVYDACSVSCGGGTQKRLRGCTNPMPSNGGAECNGESVGQRKCSEQPCPVHGGYSSWSVYSRCSKTCGSGTKRRTRACNNPSPAHGGGNCKIFGASTEKVSCNTHACPVPLSGEYTARTCEGGWLSIACSRSRTIVTTYASYGRKTKSHCGNWFNLFWRTNCHAGSSWHRVTQSCNGKSSCRVPATNGKFGDPCWGTPKYLEVRYKCRG